MLQSMQGSSFGTVMSAIEADDRPTCENEIQSKTEAPKKPRKCGSRMVKAVLFQAEDTMAQWMCPACTVHLVELHQKLSAELSERVWVVVRRDVLDPFWKWVPDSIRETASKYGYGTNSHGPRRSAIAYHCDVWCDDGYACIRATDYSLVGTIEAMRESDAQARDADLAARQSTRPDDDSAYLEMITLLSTYARMDEARVRALTGPQIPSAVKAPVPSRNKMMLHKNVISSSHVSATCAFKIGEVRVPPEPVWMLDEIHGKALSWYECEQFALGVVRGRVVGIVRSVGAYAPKPELDNVDMDENA
jgi:hypothetical protein